MTISWLRKYSVEAHKLCEIHKSNLEYSPEVYWKESFCASSVQGDAYNYGEFWEVNQVVAALVSLCCIVPEKSAEIHFLP